MTAGIKLYIERKEDKHFHSTIDGEYISLFFSLYLVNFYRCNNGQSTPRISSKSLKKKVKSPFEGTKGGG